MSASGKKLRLVTGIGGAREADIAGIRAGSNTEWGFEGEGGRRGRITDGRGSVCSGGN